MQNIKRFTVRVYGLLFNEAKTHLLLSDEYILNGNYTKFVGGGVELGEGVQAALIREFEEELRVKIEVGRHFYTTDFFVRSQFQEHIQVISIYYEVRLTEQSTDDLPCTAKKFDYEAKHGAQSFRWTALQDLQPVDVSFPIEQKVVQLLLEERNV